MKHDYKFNTLHYCFRTLIMGFPLTYDICPDAAIVPLLGVHGLVGFVIWLTAGAVSFQDKHIEEVRKNKESKDPADETEAD